MDARTCPVCRIAKLARFLVPLILLVVLLPGAVAKPATAAARPWEGTLDPSFNPEPGTYDSASDMTGLVDAVAVQPDGKILIAGQFIKYRGVTRKSIARVNPDGTLDTTFVPQTSDWNGHTIYAMGLQSDGKIIIGGTFPNYNGVQRNGIARINADGTLDTTFNPGSGFEGDVLALALLPGGKVLAGGDFSTFNGTTRSNVAVLNSDGSLDTTFDPGAGPDNRVHSVAYQPSDGKILVGGYFAQVDASTRYHLARLNTNGTLDGTFDPGTIGGNYDIIYAIHVQADGKIVVGGSFATFQGADIGGIARVNANGTRDTSFDPGSGANYAVLSILPDQFGRLLIGGDLTSYNGVARNYLARINRDGSLDTSFDPGTGADGFVHSMALQQDARVLIGGEFTSYDGTPRHGVARVNAFGFRLFLPLTIR